jgi:hypothetical protein
VSYIFYKLPNLYNFQDLARVASGLSFSSMDVVKGDYRINSKCKLEVDDDQTAIGLLVTSALFLIVKSFW